MSAAFIQQHPASSFVIGSPYRRFEGGVGWGDPLRVGGMIVVKSLKERSEFFTIQHECGLDYEWGERE